MEEAMDAIENRTTSLRKASRHKTYLLPHHLIISMGKQDLGNLD
jgi:hypothetical protein